ncbi:MAG: TatD family hydrolase [Oscillospiraceae bacterium]
MTLFDTHAHYTDEAFDSDRDAVLSGLAAQNVGLVVCPADTIESSKAVITLASRYDFLYAAVGIHPLSVADQPAGWLEELRVLAKKPKVVAIGEIGLDYFYEADSKIAQQELLDKQLTLAEEVGLPVIIHDRDAHADCLNLVRRHPNVRGVYHCYSGGIEDAKVLLSLGWMLSFTGAITFKNARRALEVIEQLPLEKVMIETDSPYLAPVPYRGKRNDSGYVHLVAEKIAELKGISVDEVGRITTENGKKFFGIKD